MTDLVRDGIEELVGAKRHETLHLGRTDTAAERIYIMHSKKCLEELGAENLRDCWYSHALDKGINLDDWRGYEDQPVVLLAPASGGLFPEHMEES